MFSALSKTEIIILTTFHLPSANALNLNKSKILSFGKDLIDILIQGIFLLAMYQLIPSVYINLILLIVGAIINIFLEHQSML